VIERVGSPDQIGRVVELGRRFHAASIWRDVPFDEADVRAMVERLVAGAGAVWLSPAGIVGVVRSPLWFNVSVHVAVEMFWYAEDGAGRALRDAAEAWAAAEGLAYHQLSGLADGREAALRRYLARDGYEAKEVAYMKRLN
jgi:hypothetical protein